MKRKLPNLKCDLIGEVFVYFNSGINYKEKISHTISIHANNDFSKYISLYLEKDDNICQMSIPRHVSQSKFYDILYDKYNTHFRSKISKATIQEIDRYFKLTLVS